ncbi:hypothetical protein [Rhodopirellula islandica]|uniref:hypothetical protein n=1 Tax=Rhodopirellula islandica TaxID=595434 RepID=UPI001F17C724|nr:hypothetical protein [Rhodopirellula islandica]
MSTFYFWLVRANRERAKLAACTVTGLRGTMLMAMEDTATYRRVAPGKKQIVLKYWLNLAIVNNSSLPNALLGIKVWMKFTDGRWHAMDVASVDPEADLFPQNIDPLTTAGMKLALATEWEGDVSGGFRERECAAGDALPELAPVRIELEALQGQVFVSEWLDDGRLLQRTTEQSGLAAA